MIQPGDTLAGEEQVCRKGRGGWQTEQESPVCTGKGSQWYPGLHQQQYGMPWAEGNDHPALFGTH